MARPVILGNGGLTVGLDEYGLVHDFYYPYVGLENLTTARSHPHYIGVWVDGQFSWITDQSWQSSISFEDDALVSTITMTNNDLGVQLTFSDFVDNHYDMFARIITIHNLRESDRDCRIFFHQKFEISDNGRADTVLFVPDGPYMLDYKGHCSLLAYAQLEDGTPFDQYVAGSAGIEGKEGTFRDAEDGELSMWPVEHAGVDSTLRCSVPLTAQGSSTVHYWLIAADNQSRLELIHETILATGLDAKLQSTRQHWRDWLAIASDQLERIPDRYRQLAQKSLMVIKVHTDDHGGIIASCDSSIFNYGRDYYSYVWPRDGAYAIWPLIKMGYRHEPKKFFEFCRSILHPDGYLQHKFQPDRAIGSTWHPLTHGRRRELAIQEDETAIVLFMLHQFACYSGDWEYVAGLYDVLVRPTATFMARFIDDSTSLVHGSYDLWEEKFLSSTYTNSITYRSLIVAADIAHRLGMHDDHNTWQMAAQRLLSAQPLLFSEEKGYFVKGLLQTGEQRTIDSVLDVSSLFGVWKYDYNTNYDYLTRTVAAIESKLHNVSPSGGSPRYEHDNYFKSDPPHMGNPWSVTTLWMGQYYAANGQKDKAWDCINWTVDKMLPSGMMSEQIDPETGFCIGVTPLVWSHAELLNTLMDVV